MAAEEPPEPDPPPPPPPVPSCSLATPRPRRAPSAKGPLAIARLDAPGPSGIKQCFRVARSPGRRVARSPRRPEVPEPSPSTSTAPPPVAAPPPPPPPRAPKRHDCRHCHKKFGSPGKLSQHALSHTGELPFACPRCDKRFNSKFKLARHSLIHGDARPHACPHCSRAFHRKDHLANHARVHDPVKYVYACEKPSCKKQYASPLNYKKHMALHSAEEGNLDCEICSESFDTKEAIVHHLKVHAGSRTVKNEGDKKFNCDKCERRFFTAKDVRRHLVVHTGRRDFACPHCEHAFGRKDHLVRHTKKAHRDAVVGRPEPERRRARTEAKKPETRLAKRQSEEGGGLVESASKSTSERLPDAGDVFRYAVDVAAPATVFGVDPTYLEDRSIEVKDEPSAEPISTTLTLSSDMEPTPSTSGLAKFLEEEQFSEEIIFMLPASPAFSPMELETMEFSTRPSEGELGGCDSDLGGPELVTVTGLEAGGPSERPVENVMIGDGSHGSQMTHEELRMLTKEGQALPTFKDIFSTTAPSPKPQHPPK